MKILVGVDGTPSSIHALRWALARAEHVGGEVRAHVTWWYPGGLDFPFEVASAEEMGLRARTAAREAMSDAGIDTDLEVSSGEGNVASDLLRQAKEWGADLIVVGTRGMGLVKRVLLGSVSRQLASRSVVPVAIVPQTADVGAWTRLVVGVDGSDNGQAALRWALQQPVERIEVVHAWHPIYVYNTPMLPLPMFETAAKETLSECMIRAGEDENDQRVVPLTRQGPAGAVLVAEGVGASAVVVGQRGTGALTAAILGSVAHHVAGDAETAVIVVPHND